MYRPLFFVLALAASLFATSAQATTYDVESFRDDRHSVWLPDLDQRHLHFEPGASLEVGDDAWHLSGNLRSGTDDSKWSIEVDFTHILTGEEFGVLTGRDDARIKGTNWANEREDWLFARDVQGTITELETGRTFSFVRMPGPGDYWAQLGTCLNDKNCDFGMSSWMTLTDDATGETYRGDINLNVSNPVPEPSAALVFGLGSVIAGTFVRRERV